MAVVRLELDIDGDVYPELYAALTALGQPMLRDERLRQLAAMGLAWEAVRIHGPAVTQLPAWAAPPPAMAERAGVPAPRSASRPAAKSPARKPGGRAEASEPAQLPVLVDIVSASPGDIAPSRSPDADDGPDPPVDPMPERAASRGSGSRARLLRMKDRGLFKNG
jgi:hypothetical protein